MVQDESARQRPCQRAHVGGHLQVGKQAPPDRWHHGAHTVGLRRCQIACARPLQKAQRQDRPDILREGQGQLGDCEAQERPDHHGLVPEAVPHLAPERAGERHAQHGTHIHGNARKRQDAGRCVQRLQVHRPERPAHFHGAHGNELDHEQRVNQAGQGPGCGWRGVHQAGSVA